MIDFAWPRATCLYAPSARDGFAIIAALTATLTARYCPAVHRALGVVLGGALLVACNPTLNWRETRIQDTALVAMLPCKPDVGARTVPLGGRDVMLHMTGCDAGDATFAVAHATVASADAAPAVLSQWRKATLANMGALSSGEVPLGGALRSGATAPIRVTAEGRRKDGSAVTMQGTWFARDAQVFHAVVYAERISPEVTEAFFAGLKFQ